MRLLISFFIIVNALAILLTNTSNPGFLRPVGDLLTPYARWTRLMQRWSLFSPDPRNYVSKYYFDVKFKDGSTTRWRRPAPENWDFFQRHHASQWQKLDTAANHLENRLLWPDLASWATMYFWSDTNPPTTITLGVSQADIPPPLPEGAAEPPAAEFVFHDQNIFSYSVEKKEFLE